jgi:predicted transcriptional regulator
MSLQFTPDIAATIKGFLAGGLYKDETDVMREALVALKQREQTLVEILEGIEDEAAGRTRPWAEVKAELRVKHGTND